MGDDGIKNPPSPVWAYITKGDETDVSESKIITMLLIVR